MRGSLQHAHNMLASNQQRNYNQPILLVLHEYLCHMPSSAVLLTLPGLLQAKDPVYLMDAPLGDVVALVVSRPLGPVDTKQAISKKLESMGARVAHRVSKEVTHIIFHRQRAADEQQQLTENSELRSLYAKTAKVKPL